MLYVERLVSVRKALKPLGISCVRSQSCASLFLGLSMGRSSSWAPPGPNHCYMLVAVTFNVGTARQKSKALRVLR